MASEAQAAPTLGELLKDAPRNWGRWGDDDEVGALNYLTAEEVLRGVRAVQRGKVFTLQVRMGDPEGDPTWPGRTGSQRWMVIDKGHYLGNKAPQFPGGIEYADDVLSMFLQGSTQYDALGHTWFGDQIYNGYDAKTTIGGLAKASVLPIAERGVVGRGVLVDIARHRGKDVLDKGETFTHEDVVAVAEAQGTPIEKHDILVVRTGWIGAFYRSDRSKFHEDFIEPGLTYSRELVGWFHDMEIPNLVTDTIANEVTIDPEHGVALPLHVALMCNLGVTFTEIASLDDLAAHCAGDGQYAFLYAAAPLKVVAGTGAPVNPIVVK